MLKVDFDGNGTASWEEFGSQRYAVDYDADNDGLIEVSNLGQLNAIRWDLDGDGLLGGRDYAQAFPDAPVGMGCPSIGCTGFELTADLDFDTNGSGSADAGDDYWNDGAGWEPVGTYALDNDSLNFGAIFEGNTHAIANLFVNRGATDYVGLFGSTGGDGIIRRIRLLDVQVTGGDNVGALTGSNSRIISASHATGAIAGNIASGGLVGFNNGSITNSSASCQVTGGSVAGGLVGDQYGLLIASYATGDVSGSDIVGGLTGRNGGKITAAYATGSATASGAFAGGLVAINQGVDGIIGTVVASYSTGQVAGASDVGG